MPVVEVREEKKSLLLILTKVIFWVAILKPLE